MYINSGHPLVHWLSSIFAKYTEVTFCVSIALDVLFTISDHDFFLQCCTPDQHPSDPELCSHDLLLQCGKVPCKFNFSLYMRCESEAAVEEVAEHTV